MRNKLLRYCALIAMLCTLFFWGCDCADKNFFWGCNCADKNKDGVKISTNELSLTIGDEYQFSVQTKNVTGEASWTSSNVSVAAVSDTGLLVALREGETTIQVSYGEFFDACSVTVSTGGIVPSLEFGSVTFKNEDGIDEMKVTYMDEINLEPYVSFNGKKFHDGNFIYTVADETIGEVSNTGVFHPKKMGETEVIVTAAWRGVESIRLTRTILVVVVPNIVMDFDGGNTTSLSLYATSEFAGRSYPTEKVLTVRALENNVAQNWSCASDSDVISVSKIDADKILVKQNSYGQANVVLSYTNENQEIVSSLLPVTVDRPSVKYDRSVAIASKNGDLAKSGEFNVQELFKGQPLLTVLYNGVEIPFDGTVLNYDFALEENETAKATFEIYGANFGYEIDVDIYQNVICTIDELQEMIPMEGDNVSGSWALGCDIDLSALGEEYLTLGSSKGYFRGVFDGRGKTISNCALGVTGYGFFGRIAGTVKNFALSNVQVLGSSRTIIGYEILNGGIVEDVYVQIGKISTTNRYGLLYTATGAGGIMRQVIVESCEAKGFETKGGIIYGYAASNFALTTLEDIYVVSKEMRLAVNGDTSPYTLVVSASDYVENGTIVLYGTEYDVVNGQVEINGKSYILSQFNGVRRYDDYKGLLGNDFSSFGGYWSTESGVPTFGNIPLKEGVVIKANQATVCVPEQAKIYAFVGLVDGELVWSVSDEEIASIDENGVLTAKKVGKVTVTCSAGSYSDSCEIEFIFNGDLVIDIDEIYGDTLDLEQGEKFKIKPSLYDGELQASNVEYSVLLQDEQICSLKETATGYRLTASETGYGVTELTVRYEYYGAIIEKTVKVGIVPEFVLNLDGKETKELQIYTLSEFEGETYQNQIPLDFTVNGNSDVIIKNVWSENEEVAKIEDEVLIGVKAGSSRSAETRLVVEIDYQGFTLYRIINVIVNRPIANYETTIERFSVANGYVVDTLGEIKSLGDLITKDGEKLLDTLVFAEQETANVYIENSCVKGVKIEEELLDYERVSLSVYDETKGYKLTVMCATQIITTAQELQALVPNENVNGVLQKGTRTGFYVLGKDVDVATLTGGMLRGALQGSVFSGVFDGDGHTIENLYFGTTSGNYGVFGTIKGTVRNLAITNVSLRTGQTALGYKLVDGKADNLYIQITQLNSSERCGVLYTTDKRGQMKNVVIESVGTDSMEHNRGGIIFGYETTDFTLTYLENVHVISKDNRLAQNTVKSSAPWHIAVANNDYVENGTLTFYGVSYTVVDGFLEIAGKSNRLLRFSGVTRYDTLDDFGTTKVGSWQYNSTTAAFEYVTK